MSRSTRVLSGVAATALLAAVIAVVVAKVLRQRQVVDEAVDQIETELDDLDPLTRAAVVAKLMSDAADEVKAARPS